MKKATTPDTQVYEIRVCDDHLSEKCDGEAYTVRGMGSHAECTYGCGLFVHAWIAPRA
ncbi:hypothetical protein [Embleya sp. NPDC005575]|uniref:hypothetical protein n=1 Tax=Embleya sp. NPDC005575 TaxID=3156892 RepID=UPI0033BC55B7